MLDVAVKVFSSVPVWGAIVFALIFASAALGRSGQASKATTILFRFAVGTIATASLIAAANYIVNPFGIYPTQIFEPATLISRRPKVTMFEAYTTTPQIVIFGSSRSFPMSPASIQKATGQVAFNAAVAYGQPRDYLAWALYMEQHDRLPKTFIIGLGFEQISATADQISRIEAFDPFNDYVRSDSYVPSILSIDQTRITLSVLLNRLANRPPAGYVQAFGPDGMLSLTRPLAEAESATTDFILVRPYLSDVLSEKQFGHLTRLLELARRHHIEVIVYLPPYHPRLLEYFRQNTPFDQLKGNVVERLKTLQNVYPFTTFDFTDVQSFGGDATSIYGDMHPSDSGCEQMLTIMLRARQANAF